MNKQIFKNLKLSNKNKGFTLLETLIAILMLTISMASILTLVSNSYFAAKYAKNEFVAAYLAQEAMDYIHNDRNTTAFQGGNWNGFLAHYGDNTVPDICYSPEGCSIDVANWDTSTSVVYCDPGIYTATYGTLTCPQFYFEKTVPTTAFYHYDPNSPNAILVPFKRQIYMNLTNPDELQVLVTVEWLNGTRVRTETLSSSFLHWK